LGSFESVMQICVSELRRSPESQGYLGSHVIIYGQLSFDFVNNFLLRFKRGNMNLKPAKIAYVDAFHGDPTSNFAKKSLRLLASEEGRNKLREYLL